MDVKVTSTGKIFRRVDPCIAGMLCEALPTVFEPAKEPAAPIAPATMAAFGHVAAPCPAVAGEWGLAGSYFDAKQIVGIQIMLAGGEVLAVGGPAKGMKQRCEKALAGRKASLPSDDLIKAYARATGQSE